MVTASHSFATTTRRRRLELFDGLTFRFIAPVGRHRPCTRHNRRLRKLVDMDGQAIHLSAPTSASAFPVRRSGPRARIADSHLRAPLWKGRHCGSARWICTSHHSSQKEASNTFPVHDRPYNKLSVQSSLIHVYICLPNCTQAHSDQQVAHVSRCSCSSGCVQELA